jgi:predicted DNA-binding protein (MmcQ/YjbR family)
MNGAAVRRWCRQRPGATEETPFGPDALVYKVAGKMFAVVARNGRSATLKCDPLWAPPLRAEHPAITPGYHANKRHWNTVVLDGSVPSGLMREMLEHSYTLVVDALPRKLREELRR